jgi:iron(III) transport system substrate-binding protein
MDPRSSSRPPVRALLAALVGLAVVVGGCSSASGGSAAPSAAVGAVAGASGAPDPADPGTAAPGTILLYTSVTQDTLDAVLPAFKAAHPGIDVQVYRAPTGDIAARTAAEQRDGKIHADVLWLTDPLSMNDYAKQGALLAWQPSEAVALQPAYVTATSWGTRLVTMVIVKQASLAAGPTTWQDLTDPAYRGAEAIPNPGFAGSAFAALGYFGLAPGYGMDYYTALKANGAVQINSPDDIVTGVAQGRYKVGMTLESSATAAIKKGSPVSIVWPQPGAIAIYSPIAVIGATANEAGAEAFVNFILSKAGQKVIAGLGWQPIRSDVAGPTPGGPEVVPDWPAAFSHRDQLLSQYQAIFGG